MLTELPMIVTKAPSTRRRESGFVSLGIALVILLLITLLAFVSSRAVLFETRVTANDQRGRQALEAAEAGADYVLATYRSQGGPDANNDAIADTVASDPIVNTANTPATRFNGTDLPGFALTTSFVGGSANLVTVQSTGSSDDGTGQRTITRVASFAPTVKPSSFPLVAKLDVQASGSLTVENAYNNSTIWSGDPISGGGSADRYICDACAKEDPTYLLNGLAPSLQDDDDPSTTTDGIVSYSGIVAGVDLIVDDGRLEGATPEEYFENYFTGSAADIKSVVDLLYDTSVDANVDNKLDRLGGASVWVDGNLEMHSNSRIGCTELSNPQPCVMDPNDAINTVEPVLLIVDGDLAVNAGFEFYGFLFVSGDLTTNGDALFDGAVVVGGRVTMGSGTATVRYDPATASPNLFGADGFIAGTWRDW